jgi:D-alanine-D-alanine ligase
MILNKSSNIVIITGGFEPEKHAASITGKATYNALKNIGYLNVYIINIDSHIVTRLKKTKPDFAFISVFCKWGEDGVIQGLLEVLGIPYSGSGIEASAICNNKFFFTSIVDSLGISVPKTKLYLSIDEARKNIKKVSFPCVIKPVYQGYSMGVSVINKMEEIEDAINKAFQFSSSIILQEFIKGREFTIGVIDHPSKGSVVLPITEFSFKSINDVSMKDNDMGQGKIPASLTKKQLQKLSDQVLMIYKNVGCNGISRFDVRERENKFYFLENNTFPGLSNESYLTHQLKAANITLEELMEYLIINGLSRKPTKLDYVFI